MLSYLYAFLGVGATATLIWIVKSIKRWGAAESKKEHAERERDAAKKSANAWANRPRNWAEFAERMRKLAKKNRS